MKNCPSPSQEQSWLAHLTVAVFRSLSTALSLKHSSSDISSVHLGHFKVFLLDAYVHVANCSQCMSGMIWGLYHLRLVGLVLLSIAHLDLKLL